MATKKLNISKLAETLTPLERARLVIEDEYYTKEKGGGLLTPEERQALRDGVKNYTDEQRQEYAYYIYLWANLPFLFIDMQTCWLRLNVLGGALRTIHSRIQLYPALLRAIRLLKRYPVLISEKDYKERVERNKQQLLNEVLSIEGLAKEEAFYSLKEQKKIDEDWIDDWSYQCYLETTAEERIKSRLKFLVENEGYTEEEAKEEIKTKYDDFKKGEPTPKEKQDWEQETKNQRNRIDQLVKEGVLKIKEGKLSRYFEAERNKLVEGITIESWYNYKDKKDRDFNKALEECFNNLELEDRDNKTKDLEFAVSYSSDRILGKDNLEKDYKYHSDYEVEISIELLKAMSVLEIEDKFSFQEKIAFKEGFKKPLLFLIKEVRNKIKDLLLFKEAINYFEKKLGTNFISSTQRKDLNDYLQTGKELQNKYDEEIKNLLRDFYGRGILEQIKAEETKDEKRRKRLLELSKRKKEEMVNEFVGNINDYLIGEVKPIEEEIKEFIVCLEEEFKNMADSFLNRL